jgi:hypothetical protein
MTPTVPDTMRAIGNPAAGPPQVLQVAEQALPSPGENEVLTPAVDTEKGGDRERHPGKRATAA